MKQKIAMIHIQKEADMYVLMGGGGEKRRVAKERGIEGRQQ